MSAKAVGNPNITTFQKKKLNVRALYRKSKPGEKKEEKKNKNHLCDIVCTKSGAGGGEGQAPQHRVPCHAVLCMYAYMFVCLYVCMYVCIYVCFMLYIYI